MSAPTSDRRTTPARPDLAAEELRGTVEAARFAAGAKRTVIAPIAPLRRAPRADAPLDTEALRGEAVIVFDSDDEGWSWVQLEADRYVGYMPSEALGPNEEPTSRVRALRTFVYPGPNLKLPPVVALSYGARCLVRGVNDAYAAVPEGFIWSGHLAPAKTAEPDFVAVAERFLGVPYLWGGKSSLGIDCSGLVQLALASAGTAAPRDSDMQEGQLGAAVPIEGEHRRGDLVFWPGHVGIMQDAERLLHANGHVMAVGSEPLAEARARIKAATRHDISSVRRLV